MMRELVVNVADAVLNETKRGARHLKGLEV
jgi:hypothetical protein